MTRKTADGRIYDNVAGTEPPVIEKNKIGDTCLRVKLAFRKRNDRKISPKEIMKKNIAIALAKLRAKEMQKV